MSTSYKVATNALTALLLLTGGTVGYAQSPNHPIITEVYTDPELFGPSGDGPVGRNPSNQHQEFIEIYLPTSANLDPELNKDALNLTFYEVEGDRSSSGYTLINYRIDLPTFDLDASNGLTGVARPPNGIVVLAWADYTNSDAGKCAGNAVSCSVFAQNCADTTACVANAPTQLNGAPGNCVALVNGGVTTASDYVIVAINGRQFSGCMNLEAPDPSNPSPDDALSVINMPGEAQSGIIQNGSGIYLLVNRDAHQCQGGTNHGLNCDPLFPNCPAGGVCISSYVKLFDDKDTAQVPGACSCFPCNASCTNADPSLASGTVLLRSALLDGFAGNDDNNFDVLLQPMPEDPTIDLTSVLLPGGAYSLVIPQIPEAGGSGYLRLFADIAKTTEDVPDVIADDPVADALDAYRTISNLGPWYPTPGRTTSTTSPAELAVADASLQVFEVLAETTGRPRLIAANVGGNFAMNVTATPGTSSNAAVATFATGDVLTVNTGQTLIYPNIAATGMPTAAHGATVTVPVNVEGVKVNAPDPNVLNPTWATTATLRVLNPTTGLNAAGLPFQTTVFVAIQPITAQVGVANELLATDLGAFIAANLGGLAQDTFGHGAALVNPTTDIGNFLVVDPMINGLPKDGEECLTWLPRPGIPLPGFAQTVTNSAEVLSGAITYDDSIRTCISTLETVIRGIRVNVPDTQTFGGTFSPSERVHFAGSAGEVGDTSSGLSNVTTSRTFEIALIDTAVKTGGLESGQTDDFGIIVEVKDTEPGAPVVLGDFVFLSFTGGLEGTDIETLDVPPGNNIATAILLDLDNLHNFMGIISIEAVFIVDARRGGNVDIIEGFSLNPSGGNPVGCTTNAQCSDGNPCTDDVCNIATGQCSHSNNTTLCDDGNLCTLNDICSGGSCSGTPITCPGNQFCNPADGICGDCVAAAAPLAGPSGILRSRYISIVPRNPGVPTAFQVTLTNPTHFPSWDLTTRWVGAPTLFPEEDSSNPARTFVGAALQCSPTFHDWTGFDVVHLFGAEIMPGATYEIRSIFQACVGAIGDPASFSDPLIIGTGKWGDAVSPFFVNPGDLQPDFKDIASLVKKFLGTADAPIKASTQLKPNVPFPDRPLSFKDISAGVSSFLGVPYPDASAILGPCVCPSIVTCGVAPCITDADCGDGFCIAGTCTDACARCTP